jgi:predicted Rossmann fold nucleotide-binding protein DprA/Smf involved in DNA uptake
MEVHKIEPGDSHYPSLLPERAADAVPRALYALGDPSILRNRLLGLVCSIQCPGSVVIRTFDAIRVLRDAGVTMIGGFHSPMERECLDLLLRGTQPVVLCAARSLHGVRIGQKARKALKEDRLLLLSAFGNEVRRTTSPHAVERNDLVAALADAVFVPYAVPSGKTWAAVCKALERGQKVFALDDEANTYLFAHGVRACRSDSLGELLSSLGKS